VSPSPAVRWLVATVAPLQGVAAVCLGAGLRLGEK
jgi:hypothetical protein